MYLGRFNSIKLRMHLNKMVQNNINPKNVSNIYSCTHRIFNINHYQHEMEPYNELIDYIYNSLALNNIKKYDNFYMVQEEYNKYRDDLSSMYSMKSPRYIVPNGKYSVLYFYKINSTITIDSHKFIHNPNESELICVNNPYKQIFKSNGNIGVLKLNFI